MRLYNLSRELRMPPYQGALMDQPDGAVKRLEIIMSIRHEDEERAASNKGPPRA